MTWRVVSERRNLLNQIFSRLFERFGPQHWWPADEPFEVMVGAILTQNTNWGNVEKAIHNLRESRALAPRTIYSLSDEELIRLVRPAGYYNVKARRLKEFARFFLDRYRGDISLMQESDTDGLRRELIGIRGVGPETADSMLLYALHRPVFVIDAYTKRILARHGMLGVSDGYDAFQGLFHEALPRDTRLYNEYHALLVRLGKEFCRIKPRCGDCPLSEMLP